MSDYRGGYTRSHPNVGDCVADFIRVHLPDYEGDQFEALWTALGILVDLGIRRRPVVQVNVPPESAELYQKALTTIEEDQGDPQPEQVGQLETSTGGPLMAVDGRRDCWICDRVFESHRGLSAHLGQMHKPEMKLPGKVAADKQSRAEVLWAKSHAPNVPYPGQGVEA